MDEQEAWRQAGMLAWQGKVNDDESQSEAELAARHLLFSTAGGEAKGGEAKLSYGMLCYAKPKAPINQKQSRMVRWPDGNRCCVLYAIRYGCGKAGGFIIHNSE